MEQTVCIVQSTCINVHTVTGKDFISPLPFQVSGGGGAWEIEKTALLSKNSLAVSYNTSLC